MPPRLRQGQDCYTLDSPFFTESCSAKGDYWVDTSAGRISWTNFCIDEESVDVVTIVGIIGMVGVAILGCRLVKLVRDKQYARAEFDSLMHGGAVAIGTPEAPDHRTGSASVQGDQAINETLDFNADEHQVPWFSPKARPHAPCPAIPSEARRGNPPPSPSLCV